MPGSGALRPLALRAARPVVIFAATRVGVLMVAWTVGIITHQGISRSLIRWDSTWYLTAARRGYPSAIPPGTGNHAQSTLGFFPLFPLLIRVAWKVTGLGIDGSGLLVGAVGGLAGAIAIWFLFEGEYGPSAADRGCALVLCSPGAYVLSMVYSETLLLPLAATCLLALRGRRWWLAGVLAGLATATDPVGIAIVVPCAVAGWLAIKRHRDWSALAAPVLAPTGILAFFGYLWVHTGTPKAWFIAQRRGWEQGHLASGIWNQLLVVRVYHVSLAPYTVKVAGFVVAMAALGLFLATRRPGIWTVYVGAVLTLAFLSPTVGFGPRTLLRAFPLIGTVGARLDSRWFEGLLAISTLAMAATAVLSFGSLTLPP